MDQKPTRPMKELYKVLLDNFEKMMSYNWGICALISECYYKKLLTKEEYYLLEVDFKQRRPTFRSKFWWKASYNRLASTEAWWWEKSTNGMKQRKYFLISVYKHLANNSG